MRFALIATSAAAVVAVPLAVAAAAPQMTADQFLGAVRCAAFEAAVDPRAELGAVKMQLNAEARRQPAETAAQAQAEARAIALQAVIGESGAAGSKIASELNAACSDGLLMSDAAAARAA